MKVLLLFLLMSFSTKYLTAQKADLITKPSADTLIFNNVEAEPEFLGGLDQFYKFLSHNIRYPQEARNRKDHGKVLIQMVIEKDGSLSNIKVVRSVSPELDQEAMRVISICPKWKPGFQNGQGVRVIYTIPITFNLSDKVYFLRD